MNNSKYYANNDFEKKIIIQPLELDFSNDQL